MARPLRGTWNRLVSIITAVEDRVTARVTAHLRDPKPTKQRAVEDRSYIRGILAELDRQIPLEVFPIIETAYDSGARHVGRAPQVDLFPPVNDVSRLRREAVNILADNATHRLGDASQTVGRRVDDIFRRHGLRAAAARALNNTALPLTQDADALVRTFQEKGIKSFEDKAGRQWGLSTYAEMVLRTTTAEAQNRGAINAMLSRNLDLATVHHADPHHPHDVCDQYNGKTFSLTGNTNGYPVLDRIPPFHPNCDHYLMPAPEAFKVRTLREAA
jgi:hypothetical protein